MQPQKKHHSGAARVHLSRPVPHALKTPFENPQNPLSHFKPQVRDETQSKSLYISYFTSLLFV